MFEMEAYEMTGLQDNLKSWITTDWTFVNVIN